MSVPPSAPRAAWGSILIMRFTIMGEAFPDPKDFDTWVSTPMWPGNDPSENVAYTSQHDAITKYVREDMGIINRKVTHICQGLVGQQSARFEQGIDHQVRMLQLGMS